jgi:hypothetical protein
MSTPDSQNLLVGSGEVFFNRRELDGTHKGFRHLGNVSKLELAPAITAIESKSSMDAARAVRQRAITETKMQVNITMDEYDPQNVALVLLGNAAAFAQSAVTKTDAALGSAKVGYAIDTGFVSITVTSVKKGATVFVEGTDYTVNKASGLIMVLAGGAILDDDTLLWSGTVPAVTSSQVYALSNGNIEGVLKFVSSDDQVGPRQLVTVYRLSLNPTGTMALITDAFGQLELQGEALSDDTRPKGKKFADSIYLPAA